VISDLVGTKYRSALAITSAIFGVLSSSNFAPAYAASGQEPVKIGFVTSQSGAAAPSAKYTINGIQLLMDKLHNQMAGRKVELLIENDESSPVTAMAKARKLIEVDKVQVVDGFVLAHLGYAVAPMTDKYQVPFIFNVAGGDDDTQRKHFDWLVRSGWSASQPTQPLGEYALKKLNYKRIVTLGMDYPFGWEQVGGFQKAFEEAGGKVVQKLWPPLGFLDFTTYVKDVHKDADAIFLCTFGKAAEILPKQFKAYGPKMPVLGSGAAFDESVLPIIGDPAIGAISSLSYSAALDNPANKKFVAAYRAKYHEDPNWYAECGYTSGLFIKAAMESLKGDISDKKKFLAALKHVDIKDAPRGPIKMDNHANPIENVYIRRVDKVNGKLQNTVIATYPMVSQFFHWPEAQFLAQPLYTKNYPACTFCSDTSK
jgi:branched-chain amino acid transport system substrate-binding protein